ncbi:MAG: hypothetical protein DMF61_07195 [Blastocatellia bacterium AA13]|nr:MAG: hypothetical protein DMF61_07195 [Blastocatellia bacterium AA13]
MARRVFFNRKTGLCIPLLALAFLFVPSNAGAQDLFEIQVYPYDTVEPHHTMFEFHMNFFPSGTKTTENGKFPVNHQFHFTTEITHGITKHFELAGYIVTAWVPDVGPKFAGARIRPRFRLPEEWHLPFKFSLSTELGFNKHQFDSNTITLELRPIIEKELGKWYLSFNPDFAKSFKGTDSHRGFGFEPGVKVSYAVTKKVEPGIEYYAETGPISHFEPIEDQHHIVFGTVDVNTTPNWELNFGVGKGLTGSSEHWIVKWIVGYRFGF